MLDVVSSISASDATVLFDFNSSLLPETPAKTVFCTGTCYGVPESAGAGGPDGSPPKSLRTSFPAVKNVVACKIYLADNFL